MGAGGLLNEDQIKELGDQHMDAKKRAEMLSMPRVQLAYNHRVVN